MPAGYARTLTAALLLLMPAWAEAAAVEPGALWRALAGGGHVALMRHAEAPGTGDPPEFRIGDCSTQRNLDETGRAQARRAGESMRRFLDGLPVGGPSVVLVSHQATISALTGAYPRSGAIVVLKLKDSGVFDVAGSIPPS
jgi:broad specificity phosphatase PhoE